MVYVKPQNVNPLTGLIVDKNNPATTIAEVIKSDLQFRVVPDASVPNSATSPTIDDYLQLESASGFKLVQLSNTVIVTESAS